MTAARSKSLLSASESNSGRVKQPSAPVVQGPMMIQFKLEVAAMTARTTTFLSDLTSFPALW